MKKNLLILSLLSFILFSCAKEKNSPGLGDHPEIPVHSDDESQYSNDMDEITNEITAALESDGSFSGRFQSLQNVVCDATAVYDGASNPKKITITYAGGNCNPLRSRTGTIVISMAQGVQWKNANATVTVSFQNVKITRTRDNKSITINGTFSYTNTSGGLLINLATLGSIRHRISSGEFSVAFDNSTQTIWQVDKQRRFSLSNGVIVSVTGLHTEGTNTGIAVWGTNRNNRTFFTSIQTPLVYRQDCSFRLTSGKIEHRANAFISTVTFGLNASGAPTTCPGTGNYYMKTTWSGPGGSYSAILPY